MSIRTSFEEDTIINFEVFLTDEEQSELLDELNKLIELSDPEDTGSLKAGDVIGLAGLAFVAGRAYQRELSASEDAGDYVTVDLSKETIESLLARVITDVLRSD